MESNEKRPAWYDFYGTYLLIKERRGVSAAGYWLLLLILSQSIVWGCGAALIVRIWLGYAE